MEVSKLQSEARQNAKKTSFQFFVKMSSTQKWGESILERGDIRSTGNGNDDTPYGSELSWSGVISRVPKMSTTTRVKGTGVGPGVDVLFGTSGSQAR